MSTATSTNVSPDLSGLSLGHQPEIRTIPLHQVEYDPRVQRALLDEKRAAKIAANFNMDAFGVPVVSERANGQMVFLDGATRSAAYRMNNFPSDEVKCEVYTGLTLAEEAAMFRLRNNTESIRYFDRWRVRVVEGEPTATAVKELIERYGWKIDMSNIDGVFAAVQRLERIYLLNPAAAERAVAVATKAWGHERTASDGRLIEGLGLLFNRYGTAVDIDDLVARLARFPGGPGALIGKARGLRDMIGGTVPKAVAEVVVQTYNARRRLHALPGWRSS